MLSLAAGETILSPHTARSLQISELLRKGGADRPELDPGLYHVSVDLWHGWRNYEFPAGTLYLW